MKITKRDLKKMIMEVLQESESPFTPPVETEVDPAAPAAPEALERTKGELQKYLRGKTGSGLGKEAGALSGQLEVRATNFIQALADEINKPGPGVNAMVLQLLDRALKATVQITSKE